MNLSAIDAMKHSPIKNYAIPGLTSWLIGEPGDKGCVRLFECSRNHVEPVTPHSHRFNFSCLVLEGRVINRIWSKSELEKETDLYHDLYQVKMLKYHGDPGKYETEIIGQCYWGFNDFTFQAGESYEMSYTSIHSIYFARNTKVLFFEGETQRDSSLILEPVVDGVAIPTFTVENWMFQRDSADDLRVKL